MSVGRQGKQDRFRSFLLNRARMPPIADLTDDEHEAALKKGGADLRYLFERNDVPIKLVAKWFHAGVTTLEKFANIAKDAADLSEVMKDHLGVDQAASLENRVIMAAVTCSWVNAKTRIQRAAEVEAELDTKEWRKPVMVSEWLAMKAGLEKAVGAVDDRLMPAKEYIEKKLQEVEAGEYRAEELGEVLSRDEVDPDTMLPQWDAKGNLTVKRGSGKIKDPGNPESLRSRLTVMRNAYQMVALKHTNRGELQGDWVRVFEEFKDYILGDHVYGLHAQDADGNTIAAPPFRLVLSYERAVRKEAVRRVNQEKTAFPVALKQAWKDPTTKERYFTTPLSLVSKRSSAATNQPSGSRGISSPAKKQRAEERPRAKGSGGKGKQMAGCASHNAEGVPICYRYNTPGERCKVKRCKFSHQCGLCFSDKHPMYQCTSQKKQPPDTSGTG